MIRWLSTKTHLLSTQNTIKWVGIILNIYTQKDNSGKWKIT